MLKNIIENYPSEVHLLEEIPAYFKLAIKGHRMPLKLNFKYHSPDSKVQVFASFTSMDPQDSPDFTRVGRPRSLFINDYSNYNYTSVDENLFHKPCLYIVLIAEVSCSLTFQATYPTEIGILKKLQDRSKHHQTNFTDLID